ncbi:hypothetical protein DUNSADRAFT_6058 [Dunaliella salina]|uniref:Encoded protein n=1 Tax=Dunaliella salina TaxID=3046 RepID=A0ABQ7GP08_DUNSA|nr:hypothetical protein DUNSADRAFT_6058 [Dunaliella salina]|eukprot:KAF5836332.1 hypothetical protein DUNSADRAFT_6058 [Dunaliella salina]
MSMFKNGWACVHQLRDYVVTIITWEQSHSWQLRRGAVAWEQSNGEASTQGSHHTGEQSHENHQTWAITLGINDTGAILWRSKDKQEQHLCRH